MKQEPKGLRSPNPIFGPVPSRRLGVSLGVDVVPMKICTYDCVYCELGKTTNRTVETYIPQVAVVVLGILRFW